MKRLVFGVLAHVDAGKTTLSEAMLYQTGELRKLGRVDHGNTFLDTEAIEKARGITIFSKEALLQVGQTAITLLDTPGHVDFSAEMERTLSALDYAVLVVSATDGVQSHTETLWKLLAHYQIPSFLFVNKMDLPIESKAGLLQDLKKRLSPNCVDFTVQGQAEWEEELSLCDETLMEQALSGQALAQQDIIEAIASRQVFPCFFGAALKLEGVDVLLAGLDAYTRQPAQGQVFGAKVFKITQDASGARLVWVKVTGGSLAAKTILESRPEAKEQWREKVEQIRLYSGDKYTQTEVLYPGMAAAVTGLSQCQVGEGLGAQPSAQTPVLEPVLNYTVLVPSGTDPYAVLCALQTIAGEDPQLHVQYQKAVEEIHLQLMGEVQLEVMQSVLRERFGLEVAFGQGRILYKETVAAPTLGIGHYEPLRHFAETHVVIEPLPQGSGIQLESTCHLDTLGRNWQNLILTHLAEKTHLGVLTGSPLTDVKITLIAGRAHLKHTEGGDFRQATYRAVRHGLCCGESVLLEPWYQFVLEVPADQIGRAMSDVQKMAGEFTPPELGQEVAILTGSAPVATMRTYPAQLSSYTRGRGRISLALQGYRPCHNAQQVVQEIGYQPDMDAENQAGSVFCSHGAGYFVPWQEVREHASIEVQWGKKAEEVFVPATPMRTTERYSGTLEQDKELLAIFEKTYGKINRAPRRAFTQPPKAATTAHKAASAPVMSGPEYLLVDGYNVLHAWDDLAALAQENLETARRRLMDMLCNYQGYRKVNLILVFDAYKVKGNIGTVEKYHGIQIVYTKEAETADSYIERVTHDIAKNHRVRVVTSDGSMQFIILGNGALRVSARSFRKELDETEREIRAYLER